MTQWWRDLLFAHWPVDAGAVRRLVPDSLEIETFEGNAWVAVVPFRMTGVRWRLTPPLPWISSFAELNFRTYVRPRSGSSEKPGVYFWSLEASNPLAVRAARSLFHLPYQDAEMRCESKREWIEYHSRRTHRGEAAAEFRGRYRPRGVAVKTDLVRWLTERYCLYVADRKGGLYRGDIHHLPWPLFDAEAQIDVNTIAIASGVELPSGPPLLHFAKELQVAIWGLERVS